MNKIIVDIIIVNWNAGDYLKEAISPLCDVNSIKLDLNIIVSDNGSADDSLSQISNLPVTIVTNESNLGFGAACNRALPFCKGKYILLLNPDTKSSITDLETLVDLMEKRTGYGTCGPSIKNEKGFTQRSCGRFPTFRTSVWNILGLSKVFPKLFTPAPIMLDWEHDESAEVDQVMGCYMLIRKSVVDQIGFMDETFFMYAEDTDFSKRVIMAGYKNFYFHDVQVYHEGGGISKRVKAKRLYYALNSNLNYWKKYISPPGYAVLIILSLTVEPFIRIMHAFSTLRLMSVREVLKAYRYLFRDFFFE